MLSRDFEPTSRLLSKGSCHPRPTSLNLTQGTVILTLPFPDEPIIASYRGRRCRRRPPGWWCSPLRQVGVSTMNSILHNAERRSSTPDGGQKTMECQGMSRECIETGGSEAIRIRGRARGTKNQPARHDGGQRMKFSYLQQLGAWIRMSKRGTQRTLVFLLHLGSKPSWSQNTDPHSRIR